LRRRAARARARRPGAAARPAPLLLEEREVGSGARAAGGGRARVLGAVRVPPLRRSVAGTAVLGRLTPRPLAWRVATVAAMREETAQTRTLALDVDGWEGHRPGQHVDVRLTAEDGYQAERSYSIGSAPRAGQLELTVERIVDCEVWPYLVDEVWEGDVFEVRGPIGGYFGLDTGLGGPLLLN